LTDLSQEKPVELIHKGLDPVWEHEPASTHGQVEGRNLRA